MVPVLQFVHTVAPDAEYVPSPHAVHAVPSLFKIVPVKDE